jgi:hypothetical protein
VDFLPKRARDQYVASLTRNHKRRTKTAVSNKPTANDHLVIAAVSKESPSNKESQDVVEATLTNQAAGRGYMYLLSTGSASCSGERKSLG